MGSKRDSYGPSDQAVLDAIDTILNEIAELAEQAISYHEISGRGDLSEKALSEKLPRRRPRVTERTRLSEDHDEKMVGQSMEATIGEFFDQWQRVKFEERKLPWTSTSLSRSCFNCPALNFPVHLSQPEREVHR
jgi:hypothetical protein